MASGLKKIFFHAKSAASREPWRRRGYILLRLPTILPSSINERFMFPLYVNFTLIICRARHPLVVRGVCKYQRFDPNILHTVKLTWLQGTSFLTFQIGGPRHYPCKSCPKWAGHRPLKTNVCCYDCIQQKICSLSAISVWRLHILHIQIIKVISIMCHLTKN